MTTDLRESSYSAESFWHLLAALVEQKINPSLYVNDGYDLTVYQDRIEKEPREGDGLAESGYTVRSQQFEVDVRAIGVSSHDIMGGDITHKFLFWFVRHHGDQHALEHWYHRMCLRIVAGVPKTAWTTTPVSS